MATLTFTRLLIAELPFVVNLPTGAYPVLMADGSMTIDLVQEHCAVSAGGQSFKLLPIAQVPADQIGSTVALRTLAQFKESLSVDAKGLSPPSDEDLAGELARRQLCRGTALAGEALLDAAMVELGTLDVVVRESLAAVVVRKLHASTLFPFEKRERFVSAVNAIVRRYMVEFQDPFAEEVVLHHLASTWTKGVLQLLQCDGMLLESDHYAGKIPPVMRRPWVVHPVEQVEYFKSALAEGLPVDPIGLLAARALAFLERGATRSAVIEASAALETSVARRILAGLLATGSSAQEASIRLRGTQRFSDRCKLLMREVTGQSLSHIEPLLWERVVRHRDEYRNKITHDDSEPPSQAARAAVQDFIALAQVAQKM